MATGADWDECGILHGLGRDAVFIGISRFCLCRRLDRRICSGRFVARTLPAPFWAIHHSGFSRARYGGTTIRLVAVGVTILASFVYVVAQIYGIGVITSRFVSLQFEIGVFVGLAGILVCSFLGGMRAVTWTQVAQYVILIIAYVTPVAILSYKRKYIPVPHQVYK